MRLLGEGAERAAEESGIARHVDKPYQKSTDPVSGAISALAQNYCGG
jgi:hypothetical protein